MSASKADPPEHKLLDEFRMRGFGTSLITTFNAYLPFYERVVLPRLVSSGCRYNIVLIDARQCAQCLAQPDTRPHLAGHAYVLVPVRAPRVFHPKICLLAGRKRGRLMIGSHNLMLAGFGGNRELTSQLEICPAADDGSKVIAAAAFRFVREWLETGLDVGGGHYLAAVDRLTGLIPWLSEAGEQSGNTLFFGNRPRGESLWAQVLGVTPSDVERATVVGPFFDKELGFLRRLTEDLEPTSVEVGVEPETASGFDASVAPARVEFRDASHLYRKGGYLHAKAIYLECRDGSRALITGSANPTKAAWLTSAGGRASNAEAVLVHLGDEASATAEALGLTSIPEQSPLEPVVRAAIRARSRVSPGHESVGGGRVTAALDCEAGLEIAVPENVEPQDATADVFGAHHEPLVPRALMRTAGNGAWILRCDQELCARARTLVIESGNSRLYAIVYHRAEIAKHTRSNRQQQLRKAIEGLEGDEPDFENLLAIVENIIFDESARVDTGSTGARKTKAENQATSDSEKPVGSLLMDLADTKKEKRRKRQRLVRQGDLAELLDLLIYNLGQSLDRVQVAGLDTRGRSEEELIGTDDEETEPEPEHQLSDEEKLEIVGKKVALLVGRIVKRLRQVAAKEREQAHALMQLLGVLALLRSLRHCDLRANWFAPPATLVPLQHRRRLLDELLPLLFGDDHRMFASALRELADTSVDEIARLRGLLLWLAWDCSLSKNRPAEFNEPEERLSERLRERAAMLCLTSEVVTDRDAVAEAENSIQNSASPAIAKRALAWVEDCLSWGRKIARFRSSPDMENRRLGDGTEVGSIVYRKAKDDFRVVAGLSGHIVSLVSLDLEEKTDRRWGAVALREVSLANDVFQTQI